MVWLWLGDGDWLQLRLPDICTLLVGVAEQVALAVAGAVWLGDSVHDADWLAPPDALPDRDAVLEPLSEPVSCTVMDADLLTDGLHVRVGVTILLNDALPLSDAVQDSDAERLLPTVGVILLLQLRDRLWVDCDTDCEPDRVPLNPSLWLPVPLWLLLRLLLRLHVGIPLHDLLWLRLGLLVGLLLTLPLGLQLPLLDALTDPDLSPLPDTDLVTDRLPPAVHVTLHVRDADGVALPLPATVPDALCDGVPLLYIVVVGLHVGLQDQLARWV